MSQITDTSRYKFDSGALAGWVGALLRILFNQPPTHLN